MTATMINPADRPVPQNTEYQMPEVGYGQDVVWYPYGDTKQKGQIAKVMEVGQRCIRLMLIDNVNEERMSVPHVSDPRLASPKIQQWGGWDYTPDHFLVRDLKAKVGRLEDRLVSLEAAFSEPRNKGK